MYRTPIQAITRAGRAVARASAVARTSRAASGAVTRASGALMLGLLGPLAICAALASGARAATPPPPKPPTVHTGYASQLTASSALIRARVNPHGLPAEYHFEYGPTVAYGAQTPPVSAGGGTLESLFTQTLAGLEGNTIYHYRVIATNSAGTVDGLDATFKTKKIPLSLTLAATPSPVVFGEPLSVSGTLAGTGNAGIEVVLEGNPFPYTRGFHSFTSPELTSATGAFSFASAGLLESTQLRVATVAKPVTLSPVATELVTVHVTLHVRPTRRRGFVRLYGTVTPAAPHAPVAFERLNHAHQFVPVAGTTVRSGASGISRFTRIVHLRKRGVYRALVQIPSGAQVSGRSRPVVIR